MTILEWSIHVKAQKKFVSNVVGEANTKSDQIQRREDLGGVRYPAKVYGSYKGKRLLLDLDLTYDCRNFFKSFSQQRFSGRKERHTL
jgi:hypothetical protein